jgi:hypothetical protein
MSRRRPTLPSGHPLSTMGAGGGHGRVRDGNGWDPSAIATGTVSRLAPRQARGRLGEGGAERCSRAAGSKGRRRMPDDPGLGKTVRWGCARRLRTLGPRRPARPAACHPGRAGGAVKVSTDSYPSAERVATRTLRADQPGVLPGVFPPKRTETSSWGGLRA